jgi:hypothetical protein
LFVILERCEESRLCFRFHPSMKAFLRILAAFLLLALLAGAVFYWNPLWVNDQHTRYRLWRAGVRSEYVNVRGDRIHYFEALPPDGSPGK